MATPNEKSEKYIGETKGVSNHIHDIIHDLSIRLDGLWRYDQYVANAESAGDKEAKKLWSDLCKSEMKTVSRLKTLLQGALGKSDS